jgi:aminomethyltransferase
MLRHTALYSEHIALDARMVDFAGWEMPLHYGSQLEEHHSVRNHAGIFDVSHMNVTDISGKNAHNFLRYLLANDIAKLTAPGKALYSCMLNEAGGVIDDLIVYYMAPQQYRLVLNAGTAQKDVAWIKQHANAYDVQVHACNDLAIIALQGPHAKNILASLFGGDYFAAIAALKPFHFLVNHLMIARTGYTGEDGYEIIMPATDAVSLWQKLLGAGAKPSGLGARDTLRLEAGFNLYGSDMDETTSPWESNLSWTLALTPTREFIGQKALIAQQENGIGRFLVGLLLEKGGVLRHGQKVYLNSDMIGEITSGGFSPTLNCSIAMARLSNPNIKACQVDLRGKLLQVSVVKPAFVRKGKSLVD